MFFINRGIFLYVSSKFYLVEADVFQIKVFRLAWFCRVAIIRLSRIQRVCEVNRLNQVLVCVKLGESYAVFEILLRRLSGNCKLPRSVIECDWFRHGIQRRSPLANSRADGNDGRYSINVHGFGILQRSAFEIFKAAEPGA